MTTTALIVELL